MGGNSRPRNLKRETEGMWSSPTNGGCSFDHAPSTTRVTPPSDQVVKPGWTSGPVFEGSGSAFSHYSIESPQHWGDRCSGDVDAPTASYRCPSGTNCRGLKLRRWVLPRNPDSPTLLGPSPRALSIPSEDSHESVHSLATDELHQSQSGQQPPKVDRTQWKGQLLQVPKDSP